MTKSKPWTQEEQKLIMDHYEKFTSKKWKKIAAILSEKGYVRSQIECRERYVNYLDPKLAKTNDISEEELKTLYDQYELHGPKWCLIQKSIPNRTQIKLKNIFYGNIRLFLKKIYKYFTKKTAVFVNYLKTDDLQALYDGTQQFKGFSLIKKALKKFNYKITQQCCYQSVSENESQYFNVLNKLLVYKTKIRPLPKQSSEEENGAHKKKSKEKNDKKGVSKLKIEVISVQDSPHQNQKQQQQIKEEKLEAPIKHNTLAQKQPKNQHNQFPLLSKYRQGPENMVYPFIFSSHHSQMPVWVPFYQGFPNWAQSSIPVWSQNLNNHPFNSQQAQKSQIKQAKNQQAGIQTQKLQEY